MVLVLALGGAGASVWLYLGKTSAEEELAASEDDAAGLREQLGITEDEQAAQEQEAQEAYEAADLPGLLNEVETLSDDLDGSMKDFAEASTKDGASVDQIETLFADMYDCMGAREEYNMSAAEHAALLGDDLPEYLSESEYPCGRDFWGV
ncbi:hypothetical protein J0910_23285 [Nocardiopsis sp. CNT-189]